MAPDNIRPFKQTLKVAYIENPFYDAPFINLHKPQILDIFYKLVDENLLTKKEYFFDEIHLNQKTMPFIIEEMKKWKFY
jgi:lysophospholipase L1-like esterase